MRGKVSFIYVDIWFVATKYKFIVKKTVLTADCVLSYFRCFRGGHKNNFRL